jgi:hypothetical protein
MRNITMTALAFCAMAAMGATAANAMTPTADNCNTMATQVKTALDANQTSSNFDAAKKEKNYGRDFCTNAMYKVGMDHYAQALKLLGVSAS